MVALIVATGAQAEPCCGLITPDGARLAQFLDQSDVMHRWLEGMHVVRQTGEPDPEWPGGRYTATHCSAFVAAMRLDIYVLRPPDHSQTLLANAQMRWLSDHGAQVGWQELPSYIEAQEAANRGELVLEALENPDPHRPGHIAIVRPSDMTREDLDRNRPLETQAGETNALSISTAAGFRRHRGAWILGGAGAIRYYAHTVSWR
jgi:hypothetical protein